MAKIQCINGHLYDTDYYSSCPYCSDSFQKMEFTGTPVGQTGWTTLLGGTPGGQGGAGNVSVQDAGKTAPVPGAFPGAERPVTQAGNVTMPPSGYRQEKRVEAENKTTTIIQKRMGINPAVGWLVCIEGKEKGKDYRLYEKVNTIGRNKNMDVCIEGDMSITGDTHARLGYDPRHNDFYIIPGNGTNNIYLNDMPVYLPSKLASYDVIELGETKLLFIALCGQRFTWEGGASPAGGGAEGTT